MIDKRDVRGDVRGIAIVLALALSALGAGSATAQDEGGDDGESGGPLIELPGQSVVMDPSASPADQRIGRADPTTIGGYGEFVFENVEDGDNEIDFKRLIVFIAHRFNEWITLYSEVEFEHASVLEMEQAYLEFRLTDELSIIAGLVIVPVGLTNLYHEPPLFHGANRPRVDRVIIPTTWREAGVGLVYRPVDWLTVQAYALSSLDATGFSASSGIRGGRQKVSQARANDVAGALRVSIEPLLGLTFSLSGYIGGADQDQLDDTDVTVSIVAADAWYRNFGLEARAQFANVFISETEALSAANEDTIGESLLGWYVELAYDVLHELDTEHQLLPFGRFEGFNTQASVADGLEASDDLDRTDITLGLSYRPIPTVVVKFDYQITESAGDADVSDQWDLGLGWMF